MDEPPRQRLAKTKNPKKGKHKEKRKRSRTLLIKVLS